MEQRKATGFQMFAFMDSKSALSGQDSSTSSGLGGLGGNGSSKGGSSSGGSSSSSSWSSQKGLVSRLGFKFDVANFDINAVSPTSW